MANWLELALEILVLIIFIVLLPRCRHLLLADTRTNRLIITIYIFFSHLALITIRVVVILRSSFAPPLLIWIGDTILISLIDNTFSSSFPFRKVSFVLLLLLLLRLFQLFHLLLHLCARLLHTLRYRGSQRAHALPET